MTHGGKRQGAGRKSKAQEVNLIEKLCALTQKLGKVFFIYLSHALFSNVHISS